MKAIKILKLFLAGYAPEDEDIEDALKELEEIGDSMLKLNEQLRILKDEIQYWKDRG